MSYGQFLGFAIASIVCFIASVVLFFLLYFKKLNEKYETTARIFMIIFILFNYGFFVCELISINGFSNAGWIVQICICTVPWLIVLCIVACANLDDPDADIPNKIIYVFSPDSLEKRYAFSSVVYKESVDM